MRKVDVGVRPNGLAYDHRRQLVLAANVGDPAVPGSYTLSMIDLDGACACGRRSPCRGRTRWAVFDPEADALLRQHLRARRRSSSSIRASPTAIARTIAVPHAGAHGLDFDPATGRLFCACDAGVLVTLDAASGKVLDEKPLSGVPDVVWFNRQRQHLYVAVGDPGVIDVFARRDARLATVETEPGAHTTALSPAGDWLCAFLPRTHRAALYEVATP